MLEKQFDFQKENALSVVSKISDHINEINKLLKEESIANLYIHFSSYSNSIYFHINNDEGMRSMISVEMTDKYISIPEQSFFDKDGEHIEEGV